MKTKSLLVALLLLFCATRMLADVYVNGIWYHLSTSNGVVTASVTYYGKTYYEYDEYSGNITIPKTITYEGSTYNVTKIGNSAFRGCSTLTSVTIPNSVTEIWANAFADCPNLKSVSIPNSVTLISDFVFENCTNLPIITIPESVSEIKQYVFNGCSKLTTVIWNAKKCSISSRFGNQVESFTIGNTVESIPHYLCIGLNKLTSIIIPNSVTNINDYAFKDCTNLTSVTIGNNVTSIGKGAFENCTSLATVTIPINVQSIGADAFRGCSTLFSIICSNPTPVSLGSNAFLNSPTAIIVPCGSLTTYKAATGWKSYASKIQNAPSSVKGVPSDDNKGEVSYPQTICENSMTATPKYGYHFTRWTDGNTDNPRTIDPTQNITYTAEFANNTYVITTAVNDALYGKVEGGKSALYLDQITLEAIPNYGYHFDRWNDNNKSNPRTITVAKDETYTATFAKNKYNITKIADNTQGSISGLSQAEYLDQVTLTAEPKYGYHFAQWSDGITENPRIFELTCDTTFTAEFAKNSYSITTTSSNPEWGTVSGDAIVLYQEQAEISASAYYGYHFVSWNDNNTINPRTILVTKDETYTASFAKNTYTITKIANNGSISGKNQAAYLDQVTLTPVPNYGYHFVQWSDGNTDNPRTIELTQDTAFTAEFAKNSYSITTASSNQEWGTTAGDATVLYQDQVEISATANYGYHFVQWNDYYTTNPRTITVTKDATYTATFAKNTYKVNKVTDNSQGSISGSSQAYYLDQVTLTAVPKYGYHFTQWSDGETENPRTFELTQDTTFTAEFAVDKSGTCGDNNMLTWKYDDNSKTLAISGEGKLNSNYTFGVEAPSQTERLIIEEGVTSIGNNAFKDKCSTVTALALPSTVTTIGDYAFAGLSNRKFNTLVLPNTIISIGAHAFDGASYLQTIHFGSVLEEIGDYAFNGCTRVREMTCLAEITPNVGTDGLTSISDLATLYVPNDYLFDYQIDNNWKRFVLKPIGATETTVSSNDVTIVADENSATITWPTSAADSYTIEITKDGEVFCRLIFNANGQLTGIAFAPSRDGQSMAPAAIMTAAGMQFTVTGLNSGTSYGYTLEAKSGTTTVASYSGSFATAGGIITNVNEVNESSFSHKVSRDGQVLILRDGKTYNLQGQEVK